jgi:hypothetical protein
MAIRDRLMNNLRVNLVGALDDAIELELFNTCDEFCRQGDAWGEVIEIELEEDTTVYALTPEKGKIFQVYLVTHDTLHTADTLYDHDTGQLSLAEMPTADDLANPLFVSVHIVPDYEATDPDDWLKSTLWDDHFQTLLEGTMARMQAQPSKPYSNPVLATYHARRFRNFMSLQRAFSSANGEPGGQNWSFPRWA